MLQIESSNIFRGASLDYNIKLMKCKRTDSNMVFVRGIANIIKNETGYDPMTYTNYRGRKFVEARQLMAVMLSEHTKDPQAVIGSYIGGKDHSTICHCKKTVDNLISTDRGFKDTFDRIYSKIIDLKKKHYERSL